MLLMSALERGIYRELLDYCWEDGYLPDDQTTLIKMARCTPAEWRKAWPAVSREFPVLEGVRRNAKVDERRPELMRWHESRRRGADATNAKRHAQRALSDTLSDSPSDTLGVSPSTSTSSSTSSTSSGGSAPAPESPPPPESNADIEKLRALLIDYGAEVGRDYGRPDDAICKRILAACRWDLAGLYQVMRAKFNAGKAPKSLGLFIEFAKEVPPHDRGSA